MIQLKRDLIQGVEFSHYLFKEHIPAGGVVIDATCGGGRDTVFLAELVGEQGSVLAFDIQPEALRRTEDLLKEHDLSERVSLINDDHRNLASYIDSPVEGILFNLGYLPGGDKTVTTGVESTLAAFKEGLGLLREGGLIVFVIYTGHPGGEEELQELLRYIGSLNERKYNAARYYFVNQEKSPAQVLAVKRRGRIGGGPSAD